MKRSRILITGASSGLGMGLAREFAARGASLALCARRSERLEVLAEEIKSQHPHTQVYLRQLDVTDHPAVFDAFEALASDLQGIDRVIVNAGIGKGRALGTGGFADNRSTLETNLIGGLAQIEAAMQLFRRQQTGHLVVISSMAAFRGLRRAQTAYAASKAGIAMLAEGLRAELKGRGAIRVSTIFPGYIRTELNEHMRRAPFSIDVQTGCRALVRAIEKESDTAVVPRWPWQLIGVLMRNLPLPLVNRLI